MGYEPSNKPSMITIASNTGTSIAISAVAGDLTLPDIGIPNYTGKLLAAFLMYSQTGINQGAAGASVDGNQYIQIDNSDGSGYHNAILIVNGSFYLASALLYSYFTEQNGETDIKEYCGSGKTLSIKWASAKMTAGTQNQYNPRLYLNLIFE